MREAHRNVVERDAPEHEHQRELRQPDQHQRREGETHGGEHERDDRDRENELEHPAVGVQTGKDRREDVVDDERDRVWQVEEVRERPDPSVGERHSPPGGSFDERCQSTGRDDAPRVDEPEDERCREDGEREQDDEAGGFDPLVASRPRQEVRQRERPTDRCNREADEEQRRESCGRAAVRGLSLHVYLYLCSRLGGFRNPSTQILRLVRGTTT